MELNRPPVLTVSASEHRDFEERCRKLNEADYRMVASSCGIMNSDTYDFPTYLEAIFVDRCLDT